MKARTLSVVALGKGGGHLFGLTLDAQGNIYAANLARETVVKFALDGKVLKVIKSESGWAPSGVAVSGSDLYILEGLRVRKISADGNAVTLGTVGEKTNASVTNNSSNISESSSSKWFLTFFALASMVATMNVNKRNK